MVAEAASQAQEKLLAQVTQLSNLANSLVTRLRRLLPLPSQRVGMTCSSGLRQLRGRRCGALSNTARGSQPSMTKDSCIRFLARFASFLPQHFTQRCDDVVIRHCARTKSPPVHRTSTVAIVSEDPSRPSLHRPTRVSKQQNMGSTENTIVLYTNHTCTCEWTMSPTRAYLPHPPKAYGGQGQTGRMCASPSWGLPSRSESSTLTAPAQLISSI